MKSILNSEKLIQWADSKIDGLEVSSDDRTRIVASCLDIAIEHQKAIILLITNKVYGSAFALVRLLFEAYIRGLWLNYCASDKEINKFKKGKLDKKFDQLIKDIENIDGYNVGVLSKAKQAGWKVMNSFTHSGFNQVVRRNTNSTIEPNYPVEEVEEAINFANAIGLLSYLGMSFLSKKNELSIEILKKIDEIKIP